MKLSEYNQQFRNTIESNKRIGKLPETWDSLISEFLRQLDLLNALPRRTKRYGDTPLDEIVIPEVFRKFVAPDSVTDTGNEEDEDWLIREQGLPVEEIWTDVEFYNFYNMFRLVTGRDATVRLSDARISAQITSESRLSFSYFGKACAGNITKTVPWELARRVCVEYWYSETVDTVMLRVIQRFMD